MGKLAITGNINKSNEVVDILVMLGAKNNTLPFTGAQSEQAYYIDQYNKIGWMHVKDALKEGYSVLDIDTYKRNFPYVIGDEFRDGDKIIDMYWDEDDNAIFYRTMHSDGYISTIELMTESYAKRPVSFDETKTTKIIDNKVVISDEDKVEISYNQKTHEIIKEDDKYYVIKKIIKYPSTVEECCAMFNYIPENITANGMLFGHNEIFRNLMLLRICRDAYYAIMNFTPNWDINDSYYCIYNDLDKINMEYFRYAYKLLAFPDREIAYIFYNNFKDLIETCKDYLG